jgi:hypothetical protein
VRDPGDDAGDEDHGGDDGEGAGLPGPVRTRPRPPAAPGRSPALPPRGLNGHFSPTSDRPLWSPNAVVGPTLFFLQPGGTHDAVAGARGAETGDVTWISFVPVRELPGISGTMKRPRPVLPRWLRESICLVRTKSYDGAVPTKRSMNRKDQSHGAARARAALGTA